MKKFFAIIICLTLICALFSACVPHQHEVNYDDYCKTCDYDFAKTLVLQSDGSFKSEEQSFEDNYHYSFNLVGDGQTKVKFVFTSLYRNVTVSSIKIQAEGRDTVLLPITHIGNPFSELEYDGTFIKGVTYRITVDTVSGGRGYLLLLPIS